ncbi:MAG TPA: c-type cytochrome [Pyrinomonadaceae bacterium]
MRNLLRLIAVILSIVAVFVVSNRRTDAKLGKNSVDAPPQEKTVEQTRKNIKVLNGLPDSQLIPVMNFFAASMGRRCNFCHVNNQGQWDYPSDAKPEKNTAREMIKMVMEVNKTTGRLNLDAASCYTCHRGRTSPQSLPALPLPLPSPPPNAGGGAAGAPSAQASPSPTPALPSADDIFNKYAAAIGGQSAIDKLKTRTAKGTIVQANGNSFQFELYQSGPDKFYLMVTTPQGPFERGFNGQVGWEKTTRGLREITGSELANYKTANALFSFINLKQQYASPPRVRRDKLNDHDVYVIDGTTTDGRRMRLYFDAASGLLLRRTTILSTVIGLIPDQVEFEDYRDVDGVKFAFTGRSATVEPGNPTSTRTFTEVKLNVPVDESKFNMPPATPSNP